MEHTTWKGADSKFSFNDVWNIFQEDHLPSNNFYKHHIFASASNFQGYMKDATFRFNETKKDAPIMAATNLFGDITNIHSFKDGKGRICCLILPPVLIQMKCCLFPVILSSFHRRSK